MEKPEVGYDINYLVFLLADVVGGRPELIEQANKTLSAYGLKIEQIEIDRKGF